MLIIADARIPEGAKMKLSNYGELMELETSGITYPAISGHPDIFFTLVDDQLIIAPNLPQKYFPELQNRNINYITGLNPVGQQYPKTAGYNAVVTNKYLVHKLNITDTSITEVAGQKLSIDVNQGYTRCNTIFLNDENAITSDCGIKEQLEKSGVKTLFVNPSGIQLPAFSHGFFGGCCGLFKNRLFVIGNLNKYHEGDKLKSFLEPLRIEIVELCDTPLYDGGGIFFVD